MSEPQDNLAKSRFELIEDDQTAFAAYELEGKTIAFAHTIVPPALEGRGIASRLIAYALGEARARGLKVRPECSFVAAFIERHPETQDLLG
ncbi:GNAT family N-acetyltransferase [Sphingomonas sp. PB4P5]|uniref:GNAT family N-acetyltransferase n=1 Tax=Parasphingomonas puruogangriensis TaxID=3096155 RepID=UPI002FCA21EE